MDHLGKVVLALVVRWWLRRRGRREGRHTRRGRHERRRNRNRNQDDASG